MTIKVINNQQALQDGLEVLIAHLEPAKLARFVADSKLGEGDYLKLKHKIFTRETVASLYEKVKAYQDSSSNSWFYPRCNMAKLNYTKTTDKLVKGHYIKWISISRKKNLAMHTFMLSLQQQVTPFNLHLDP